MSPLVLTLKFTVKLGAYNPSTKEFIVHTNKDNWANDLYLSRFASNGAFISVQEFDNYLQCIFFDPKRQKMIGIVKDLWRDDPEWLSTIDAVKGEYLVIKATTFAGYSYVKSATFSPVTRLMTLYVSVYGTGYQLQTINVDTGESNVLFTLSEAEGDLYDSFGIVQSN